MKYSEQVDTDKNPCPHPVDYCQYRERCVINGLCMERKDCREKKKASRGEA
jgi:hypothetical protein